MSPERADADPDVARQELDPTVVIAVDVFRFAVLAVEQVVAGIRVASGPSSARSRMPAAKPANPGKD